MSLSKCLKRSWSSNIKDNRVFGNITWLIHSQQQENMECTNLFFQECFFSHWCVCANTFLEEIFFVRSMFSYDLCAHAHAHSLEGTLLKTIQVNMEKSIQVNKGKIYMYVLPKGKDKRAWGKDHPGRHGKDQRAKGQIVNQKFGWVDGKTEGFPPL